MVSKIFQIAIPFVWFGAVAAISFVETPLKFQAPGITLPLGLGIGRLVFFALNKIEIAFLVTFALTFLSSSRIGRTATVLFSLAAVILLLETLWLLPILDARAELVMAGTTPPFSNLHVVYIVFDALKLVLLACLGVVITKRHIDRKSS